MLLRKPSPHRLYIMLLCVAGALAFLVGRLALLQLVRGETYAAEALANIVREDERPAPRGRILDRDGALLAGSRVGLTVALRYPGEQRLTERLKALAAATGVPAPDILEAVNLNRDRLFAPVVIARDVDPATYTRLAERASEYPELVLGWEPVRVYPLGPAAAHVVGYLGQVQPADVERHPDTYRPGDVRGMTGVEGACDWLLRGQPETVVYQVDAAGTAVAVLRVEKGRPGLDVRLTLDAHLQQVAYDALGETLERLRARQEGDGPPPAAGGAVVALDPTTGAVLALVSRPSFDPALFAVPQPDEVVDALRSDPRNPFLDRATAGLYTPGSTFKLITAAAALEEGVTTEEEVVFDGGMHPLVPKRCWLRGGHGPVTLTEALAVSCNVYFYEMGLRLGVERLASYARRFGLGEPTGLDLFRPHGSLGAGRSGPAPPGRAGGEPAGTVPDKAWKAAVFPDDSTFWPAEVMDAAIGEGFHTYTPLQMAVAVAAIANGGTRWRPYVIDAVLDAEGRELVRSEPEAAGRLGLSGSTLALLKEGMVDAAMRVSPVRGTAAGVFGPSFERRWGVTVAGKTGTHERDPASGLADDGWFVCFAPAESPEIVVVVIVEQGGSGSRAAAPVARAVLEAWLAGRDGP